jgi:hypothetical protein
MARAQLSWARNHKRLAEAARSTDPRLRAPEFQELRENRAIEALERMRLGSEARVHSHSASIKSQCSDQASPTWHRHAVPLPPTPPRPSQKGLEEAGGSANNAPAIMTDRAECEGRVDEEADASASDEEEAAASDEEPSDDTQGDSPRSRRLYTKEEWEILIFGDGDEDDEDVDGTAPAAVTHPGEQELAQASAIDEQGEKNDGESEGEVEVESKSDGVFGPTPNICPPFPSSHQNDDEDESTDVVQGELEAPGDSPAVSAAVDNPLDSVNSPKNDAPPTATTSTVLTSLPPPRYPSNSPPPAQFSSPQSESAALATGGAPTGDANPEELSRADPVVDGNPSDMVPVPTSQVAPLEVPEPQKSVVMMKSEAELPCGMTRPMVHKGSLPVFTPTRPGLFSAPVCDSLGHTHLGKRKRGCEGDGDGDGDARASGHLSDSQQDCEGLVPR